MRCQRCGKEISPLRQLTDREFCGESCRKRGARASASELRDLEYHEDPFWQAQHGQSQKNQKASNTALAAVVLGIIAVLVGARIWLPDGPTGGNSPLATTAPSTLPSIGDDDRDAIRLNRGSRWAWLQNVLPGERPLRMKSDFSAKLTDWVGTGQDWSVRNGVLQPGKLRLWKPTVTAKDYQLQFRAGIEKKALGWAFRAAGTDSYYASKILLTKPGEVSGASILHYGMDRSQSFGRSELPLPVALQKDKRYLITLLVDGNRFTTLIDGHVVDEWSDNRLKSGGVGFFTDDGEQAAVDWADFRETKGWLSRFLAATWLLPPGMTW